MTDEHEDFTEKTVTTGDNDEPFFANLQECSGSMRCILPAHLLSSVPTCRPASASVAR